MGDKLKYLLILTIFITVPLLSIDEFDFRQLMEKEIYEEKYLIFRKDIKSYSYNFDLDEEKESFKLVLNDGLYEVELLDHNDRIINIFKLPAKYGTTSIHRMFIKKFSEELTVVFFIYDESKLRQAEEFDVTRISWLSVPRNNLSISFMFQGPIVDIHRKDWMENESEANSFIVFKNIKGSVLDEIILKNDVRNWTYQYDSVKNIWKF